MHAVSFYLYEDQEQAKRNHRDRNQKNTCLQRVKIDWKVIGTGKLSGVTAIS